MSGLPGCDRRGTAAVHGAAVIYISPAWRGRACPVTHRKLSSFIKAPEPEIQPGICCSLPTCGGTSNSNKCKGIHAKKTKLRKKNSDSGVYFSSRSFQKALCSCVSALQSSVVSLWSNIQALFAMCKPPLCWRGYSPTKNMLCFTMWRNKTNWDAVTCTSGTYSGANAVSLLAMKSPPSPPLSASLQQTVSSVHLGLNNQSASFQL